MFGYVVLAFVLVLGPLALLWGVDSRLDDARHGWPGAPRR
jgi:hypothetical protein